MKFHKTLFLGVSLMLAAAYSSTVSAIVFFGANEADCGSINGSWDGPNLTCRLTADYEGDIFLTSGASGMTLDGAGYEVKLGPTGGQIQILGSNITFKDLRIVSSQPDTGFGIYINGNSGGGDNNTISNVTISGTWKGIVAGNGADDNIISNNIISGQNGIEINNGSSKNQVTGNIVSTNYPNGNGITIGTSGAASRENIVSENTISNFIYGVNDGQFSENSDVFNNNFFGNNISIAPLNHIRGNGSSLYHANHYDVFDTVAEGCSDNNLDGICDSAYTLIFGRASADPVPWVTLDGWLNNTSDASGIVTASTGGTVATDDGGVVIDVAANSVGFDTTITVDLVAVTEPDVVVGPSASTATALAIYDFGPDGTTFDPAALITLIIDVTDLSSAERSLISIYRHEDTNSDGVINSDDAFVEVPGAECEISTGSYSSTIIATCTAPVVHFSTYAIILPDDTDGDGVADDHELCPGTVFGELADRNGCSDSQVDSDHDQICDSSAPSNGPSMCSGADNCPLVANLDQTDFDGDGQGDACDSDDDNDGVMDSSDICASTPLGILVSPATGCSIEQLCPCEGLQGSTEKWRNHGKYTSCTARASEAFVALGLISDWEKDAIVSEAAQSSCGVKKK